MLKDPWQSRKQEHAQKQRLSCLQRTWETLGRLIYSLPNSFLWEGLWTFLSNISCRKKIGFMKCFIHLHFLRDIPPGSPKLIAVVQSTYNSAFWSCEFVLWARSSSLTRSWLDHGILESSLENISRRCYSGACQLDSYRPRPPSLLRDQQLYFNLSYLKHNGDIKQCLAVLTEVTKECHGVGPAYGDAKHNHH